MTELKIEIRPGRREDVPGVDALLARSYPQLLKADYPPSTLVTAVPLISRAQPGLITCGTYHVATTEAGRIIAAGGWTRRNPSTGQAMQGLGNIRHFATDPAYLRRGIASALMDRCLREARAEGLRTMACYSTRTAVPFYARHGFRTLAEVTIELSAGVSFPAVAMERHL